jgi:hypothetical protein
MPQNSDPRPHPMGKAIATWAGIGAVVGVLVFIVRMLIDQDRIGANVVWYLLVGAALGAALAYFRGGRVPKP